MFHARRHAARTPRVAGVAIAQRGLTLVELLTVIAITAILAATAIPSFNRIIVGGRIAEAGNGLRGALELARSEAIGRSARVGICRSGNANGPAPTCSAAAVGTFGATDWAVGWIIYEKAEANAGVTFEAGDVLVRRQGALADGTVGERVLVWAPAAGPIVFNWNGVRLAGPIGAFRIDHGIAGGAPGAVASSDQATCLAINIAGRLASARPVAGVCA